MSLVVRMPPPPPVAVLPENVQPASDTDVASGLMASPPPDPDEFPENVSSVAIKEP